MTRSDPQGLRVATFAGASLALIGAVLPWGWYEIREQRYALWGLTTDGPFMQYLSASPLPVKDGMVVGLLASALAVSAVCARGRGSVTGCVVSAGLLTTLAGFEMTQYIATAGAGLYPYVEAHDQIGIGLILVMCGVRSA